MKVVVRTAAATELHALAQAAFLIFGARAATRSLEACSARTAIRIGAAFMSAGAAAAHSVAVR